MAYSLDLIAKNVELMDSKQIIAIIKLCSVKNNYHSKFCFTVSDKIVTEKWNLDSTWEATKLLNRMSFSPPNLLDHLVNVIQSEQDTFRTRDFYSPLLCSEILTTTGYHPADVDKVLEILCSCTNKLLSMKEKSPYLFVKFLGALAMMGYFPDFWLKQALDEEFLYSTWSKSRKLGKTSYCLICTLFY